MTEGIHLIDVWEVIKEVLDAGYKIAGIVLVVGLFLAKRQLNTAVEQTTAVVEQTKAVIDQATIATELLGNASLQLEHMKKDTTIRNERAAAEKSIEYLSYFQNEVILKFKDYNASLSAEAKLKAPKNFDDLLLPDFKLKNPTKDVIAELVFRQEIGMLPFLNSLEFFSAVVESRITNEDLLYTPLSKLFCDYVEQERLALSALRSHQGIPFKNIVSLHERWSKRIEVEKLQLQKAEAERNIKEHGDGYKSNPPIGF